MGHKSPAVPAKSAKTVTPAAIPVSTRVFYQSSGHKQGMTELERMERMAEFLRLHPEKLKKLAVDMGIHTPKGRLTKAYGG